MATAIEYGLIGALITVVVVGALSITGTSSDEAILRPVLEGPRPDAATGGRQVVISNPYLSTGRLTLVVPKGTPLETRDGQACVLGKDNGNNLPSYSIGLLKDC